MTGDYRDNLNRIPDESVDSIITDPPYGVTGGMPIIKRVAGQRDTRTQNNWDLVDIEPFTREWLHTVWPKLKQNSFMFVFWSQKLLKLGLDIFNPARVVLWRYNNFTLGGSGDFAYDYEPIFVLKKGKPKLKPGKHTCDLEFTKPQSNFKQDRLIHPAQKPLKLVEHLLVISTVEGSTSLDPFAGSGTLGVAALSLNRHAILIEKNPDYLKLIKTRIKQP